MKNIWENNWFFVPMALFFAFGGVLAILIPYGHEILFFNDWRVEPFNAIFQFFTYCGEVWAYAFFGVAILFWKPRYTLIIAVTGILALPIGYIFKDTIGIDRPITYFEKKAVTSNLKLVPSVQLNRGQTSFPSGHTMSAFALYSLLALMTGSLHKRWGLPLAILAILTGISRVFLVQHFLVDVLAGGFLGLLLSGLTWKVASLLKKDPLEA